jgi:hypothetical protein
VAERFRGTHTETLSERQNEWGGLATIQWIKRIDEGFDPAAEHYVELAEVIDSVYEEVHAKVQRQTQRRKD